MKKFFQSVLSSHKDSVSSKRVCGVSGWIVIMAILGYCSVTGKSNPEGLGEFMLACCALLGVDSVTEIWKNKNNPQ